MPPLNKLRENIIYYIKELFRYDGYDLYDDEHRQQVLDNFSKSGADNIYNKFINGYKSIIGDYLKFILDPQLKSKTRNALTSNPKKIYTLAKLIKESFEEISAEYPFSQEKYDKKVLNNKYYNTLSKINVTGVSVDDTEEDIKELRNNLFDEILEDYSKQDFIDKVNQANDKDIHILKRKTYSKDSPVISSSFTTTYYTEYTVKFLNNQYIITVVSHVASW